jgi:uncharacterized membrane protein YbhN (UPF0104 family)
MIYFAPTPGGSGFAEMSIAVLFEKIVSSAILPLFTLLQRSFLLFFPAIIGQLLLYSFYASKPWQWNSKNEKRRKTEAHLCLYKIQKEKTTACFRRMR